MGASLCLSVCPSLSLSLSLYVSVSLSNVSDLRFPPVVIFRGCSWPFCPGALHRTLLHPTKRVVSVLWGTVPVPQLPSSKSGPKLHSGYFSQFFIFFLRHTYFINAGLTGLGDVVLLNREYCDLSFLILLYAKKEEKKEEKKNKVHRLPLARWWWELICVIKSKRVVLERIWTVKEYRFSCHLHHATSAPFGVNT